eukprot:365043-Chlamydomonas_euryale.AAC.28
MGKRGFVPKVAAATPQEHVQRQTEGSGLTLRPWLRHLDGLRHSRGERIRHATQRTAACAMFTVSIAAERTAEACHPNNSGLCNLSVQQGKGGGGAQGLTTLNHDSHTLTQTNATTHMFLTNAIAS